MFDKTFQNPIFKEFTKNKVRKEILQTEYDSLNLEQKRVFEDEFTSNFYDEDLIGVNLFSCPFRFKPRYKVNKSVFKKPTTDERIEKQIDVPVGLGLLVKVIEHEGECKVISGSHNVVCADNIAHLAKQDTQFMVPETLHFLYFDNDVMVHKTKEFINRLQSKQKIAQTRYHTDYLEQHLHSIPIGETDMNGATIIETKRMIDTDPKEFAGFKLSYVPNDEFTNYMTLKHVLPCAHDDKILRVSELSRFVNKHKNEIYEADKKMVRNFLEKNKMAFDDFITVRMLESDNGMMRIATIF